MPRLPTTLLPRLHRLTPSTFTFTRPLTTTPTYLKESPSSSSSSSSTSHNTTPGWTGRTPSDHVVNRTDKNDIQSESSQTAMKDKAEGKEGSSAISGKDEGKNTQKAKEEFPEAPDGPVLGMNDERGGKGH